MNRRKYILSTMGLGIGVGFISKYNAQPSIATNISINADTIDIPTDINEREHPPRLKINFDKFEIIEQNYYDANPNYTIESRTIYKDTKSKYTKLVDNIKLNENNQVENITDKSHIVSLKLPENLEENSLFNVTLELKFKTTNKNIGPFIKKDILTMKAKDTIELVEDNFSNSNWNIVGDDVFITEENVGGKGLRDSINYVYRKNKSDDLSSFIWTGHIKPEGYGSNQPDSWHCGGRVKLGLSESESPKNSIINILYRGSPNSGESVQFRLRNKDDEIVINESTSISNRKPIKFKIKRINDTFEAKYYQDEQLILEVDKNNISDVETHLPFITLGLEPDDPNSSGCDDGTYAEMYLENYEINY